jgi:hypothetical protein
VKRDQVQLAVESLRSTKQRESSPLTALARPVLLRGKFLRSGSSSLTTISSTNGISDSMMM